MAKVSKTNKNKKSGVIPVVKAEVIKDEGSSKILSANLESLKSSASTPCCVTEIPLGVPQSETNRTIIIDRVREHNSLYGLQGGADNEYYHLTKTEYDAILNSSNPSTENPFITQEVLEENISQGDKNFVFSQSAPSSTWNVVHDLNKKVSVTITDSAGTVVEGRVTINDGTVVEIQFNSPFSGEVILN